MPGSLISTTTPNQPAGEPKRRAAAVAQILAGLLLFVALDWSAFGTGAYLQWASPDSGLGRLYYVLKFTAEAGKASDSVVVFGDSRVGEAFSAPLANSQARLMGSSRSFLQSSVPATSPRVWYYELRRYRDLGMRPAAVVFMARQPFEAAASSAADHILDVSFLHPYLGWRDFYSFPSTFEDPSLRMRALAAILFKAWPYQADIGDFLAHPATRIESVGLWREHGREYLYDYEGRKESFDGLSLNMATGETTWTRAPQSGSKLSRRYFNQLLADHGEETESAADEAYSLYWYRASAALCQEMGAKFIVFRIPRGPFHYLASPQLTWRGSLSALASAGDLSLIPAGAFNDLERPQYYFDSIHMNRAGRLLFTPLLTREILRLVPD